MQYKKKYISDKIIEEGKREYLDKGFKGGSISLIARNAGVPVGNLYRYFDGKLGLLDAIIKPVYTEVPKVISRLSFKSGVTGIEDSEFLGLIAENILRLFDDLGGEILILIDKSEESRYEEFFDLITAQVATLVFEKNFKEESRGNRLSCRLIAKSFIQSMFDILRMRLSRELTHELVLKQLNFFFLKIDERI